MTPLQNLNHAIGELACTIANADGKAQSDKRKKFHSLLKNELSSKDYDFDVSDIIVHVLDKDRTDPETTFQWAMSPLRMNSHHLSPGLRESFLRVMEKVAAAFPPATGREKEIMERFCSEFARIS